MRAGRRFNAGTRRGGRAVDALVVETRSIFAVRDLIQLLYKLNFRTLFTPSVSSRSSGILAPQSRSRGHHGVARARGGGGPGRASRDATGRDDAVGGAYHAGALDSSRFREAPTAAAAASSRGRPARLLARRRPVGFALARAFARARRRSRRSRRSWRSRRSRRSGRWRWRGRGRRQRLLRPGRRRRVSDERLAYRLRL